MLEQLKIPGDICSLAVSIHFPAEGSSKRLLVGLTGKGGPKERFFEIGQELSKRNITTISFDFAGRGESSTAMVPPTRQQILDLQYLFDYIQQRFGSTPFDVVATSMGSLSSCVLASKYAVRKLILVAPTIIPNRLLGKPFADVTAEEVVGSSMQEFLESDTITGIKEFAGEVVLIRLLDDDVIPEKFFSIFEKNCSSAQLVKTHAIPGSHGVLHDEEHRPGLIELLRREVLEGGSEGAHIPPTKTPEKN